MIWAVLSFTVAVITLFYVMMREFLSKVDALEGNRVIIAGAFCLLGVALGVAGWARGRRKPAPAELSPDPGSPLEPIEPQSVIPLFSAQHFALIIVGMSVCVLLVSPRQSPPSSHVVAISKPPVAEQKAPAPAPSVPENRPVPVVSVRPAPPRPVQVAKAAEPEKTVKFNLQGIIVRQGQALALINGRTYQVNDKVQGADLILIGKDFVAIKDKGVSKVITLPY